MLIDLTGLPVANASLLDEATAAAEAMGLMLRATESADRAYFVDAACHPQVIAVVRTRARWLGVPLVVADAASGLDPGQFFGAHLQYPDTMGNIADPSALIARMHAGGAMVSLGVDPLALVLLKSPGALGADVAIGSAQRFGVPLGYGGPHPGFLATRSALLRQMPGRIVGVTRDAAGRPAFRMALQTREQHIRREKATSNICTSQVLLANVAGLYAVWHGPEGLERIALRTHLMARLLAAAAAPESGSFFDTLTFRADAAAVRRRAEEKRINLRYFDAVRIGVTVDETTTLADVADLAWALTGSPFDAEARARALPTGPEAIPQALRRADGILSHPLFHSHRSESAMMRYLKRLESRDYSLAQGMIPLGSCTMKLNAAAEMAPVSWPEFANLHPFAPREQAAGYHALFADVTHALGAITGLAHMTLQPNSGANGEYAGLVTIRNYHAARGEGARDVCLIPASAHGTNPASAQMAGLQVVVVACDAQGNVDVADLAAKIGRHGPRVCALMLTYPSTHGVFEEAVRDICDRVHAAGGQVYLDGANLNALAGLARVADFGADVCHINLHKTFCIPHGGGGPGMGPIAVASHLARFLPAHPLVPEEGLDQENGTVSAAPWGSPLIVTIPWMFLRMMGAAAIRRATETAILSANYVAARLKSHWPVPVRGRARPQCARVHLRPPGAEGPLRGHRRGRGEASDGLRLPRAYARLPGARDADVRADRERAQGGARPLLRRDDRHPRRGREGRRGHLAARGQSAQERAAYRGRDRGRMAPSLHARRSGLSVACPASQQVLAASEARGPGVRRHALLLRLSGAGSVGGRRHSTLICASRLNASPPMRYPTHSVTGSAPRLR